MGTGGQLGWVACSHMLEHGSLVSPLNVGPGCIPQVDQTSWVTWGYGYRWTSFAGWPVTIRWIVAAWCFPWREVTRLPPPPGGPGRLGGLGLWLQVGQLSWLACPHTIQQRSLCHGGWNRVPDTCWPGLLVNIVDLCCLAVGNRCTYSWASRNFMDEHFIA